MTSARDALSSTPFRIGRDSPATRLETTIERRVRTSSSPSSGDTPTRDAQKTLTPSGPESAEKESEPPPRSGRRKRGGTLRELVPQSFTTLAEGYGLSRFRHDTLSGLTVAIVALPLAMALAIASGTTPDRGLYTAVIAGFLISLLGGSKHQIGGPTGAFVVVVYSVIERHGFDGLVLTTLMAGVMLIAFGLARFGKVIKFIPYPVVTGFTSGIAVIIFSSQVKDVFGLSIEKVPGEFVAKWETYFAHASTFSPQSLGVALFTLFVIVAIRRFKPALPSFLIGVAAGAAAVALLSLDVATIGSRYGGIPRSLPAPGFPAITLDRLVDLSSDALTIALLAGIESLLSAVIADGMTGERHRSDCELVAQGVANCASALFGGLPATGAIARTVTNIRSGGKTPVSGMLHAVFLLVFMIALAPLASYVPLPALAAVLVIVAWNMSEIERWKHLMSAPRGDRVVLVVTFALTVLVDLTVAIEVGVVLAALLFMQRMSALTEIEAHASVLEPDVSSPDATTREISRDDLPPGVEVFQINGPFFFGVAMRLNTVLDQVRTPPKVFILRMRRVPMIDATGANALHEFIDKCHKQGTNVILTTVNPQPRKVLEKMGFGEDAHDYMRENLQEGLALARQLIAK